MRGWTLLLVVAPTLLASEAEAANASLEVAAPVDDPGPPEYCVTLAPGHSPPVVVDLENCRPPL